MLPSSLIYPSYTDASFYQINLSKITKSSVFLMIEKPYGIEYVPFKLASNHSNYPAIINEKLPRPTYPLW